MATVFFKLGDDISTDVIYPDRYMATVLPTETPQYAFVDNAEVNAKLKAKQVPPGSEQRPLAYDEPLCASHDGRRTPTTTCSTSPWNGRPVAEIEEALWGVPARPGGGE